MRVLLINPPYRAEQRYGKDMAKFGPTNEPLGLAYLAGMLEAHGHEVQIWDGNVERHFGQTFYQKPDLIGVSICTPAYESAKALIERIRNWYYEGWEHIPIVVGGPHPTALPEETLDDIPEIDFVIVGEGERLISILMGAIEKFGRIPKKQQIIRDNQPFKNIDNIPLPARHLLPMDRYQMTASRNRGHHAYTVIVARGCPFNCGFCSRIHGKKVRFHSVERVLQEVEILIRDYGAKEINFEADTLTLKRSFVGDLCEGLIVNGLSKRIRWTCESRIDTVDPDMLNVMKQAGCWQISYGVETGSQRLLDLIQKGTKIDKIEQTFRITKKAGLNIRAFYMLGLPTETRQETQQTINFAKKLNADWSQFTLYTPFPGTHLWDLAQQEAPISRDWSDFQTHAGWTDRRPAWMPKGRTAQEMKETQKRAYRAVYLRPGKMIQLLGRLPNQTLYRGFWTLIKTMFPKSKLVRVDKEDLKAYAWRHYVDSPVYFDAIWPVRELNWRKLGKLLSMVNGESGTALDLCCGNGVLLPSLSRMFDNVIGVDLYVEAAQQLVRRNGLSNVQVIYGDGYALPLGDNSIDVIFAASCLEHFKDLLGIFFEIRRVLKPGGKMFCLSPNEDWFYRLGRKVFGYTKPEDHYHSGKVICRFLPMKSKDYPALLPIYTIGTYEKRSG